MLYRSLTIFSCLAVGCLLIPNAAQAAPTVWNIVSSASSIALGIPIQTVTLTSLSGFDQAGLLGTSATMSLRPLNPGTGTFSTPTAWVVGNKQSLQGTISTNTDFVSSIEFLEDSDIQGVDSGAYAPLATGDPGTASADFGVRFFARGNVAGFGDVDSFTTDVALRNVTYALSSSPLLLSGGSFDSSSASFGMDAGSNMAFRARGLGGLAGYLLVDLIGSGAGTLSAMTAGNTAGPGQIVSVGPGMYQMTIPVNIPIEFVSVESTGLLSFKATLTGTLVATATPEPSTVGLLASGLAMISPLIARRLRRVGTNSTSSQ